MAKAKEKAVNKVAQPEQQNASAFLKSVKLSPAKISRLSRLLVGMPVQEATKRLSFSNLKAATYLNKLIFSAMSNAENNHGMDIDNLSIERIDVGKAFVLKRFRARARGRANRILKRFSNIRIVLTEKS